MGRPVMEERRRSLQAILARRGGKPSPNSWVLTFEAWEQRSRERPCFRSASALETVGSDVGVCRHEDRFPAEAFESRKIRAATRWTNAVTCWLPTCEALPNNRKV